MFESGQSQDNVAKRFNVSQSTIVRLVRRVNATGSLSDRPRPCAPRVTSVRQDNFIRLRHLRDRNVTAQSTVSTVMGIRGRTISRKTVRNRLNDRGIRCRKPYHGPVLSRRYRPARQQWALNNRRRQWRTVVLVKSQYLTSSTLMPAFEYTDVADNCAMDHNRFGGGGVMVWAAINHNLKSELVSAHGKAVCRPAASTSCSSDVPSEPRPYIYPR